MRSPLLRWGLGSLAVVVVPGVLRAKPWAEKEAPESEERQTLGVGFLPVTCHLTCPVTDFASKTSHSTRFESQRFTDFPTMVETMKSGRLEATFMIAPLAMKLQEQGVKVKIAYLGHRDGSTVMVRKDLPSKTLADLEGMMVTEKLIAERPAVVKDLVRGIAESGEWAETHRTDAARLGSPYFRQDEKLARYVLTQPPDRVMMFRSIQRGADGTSDCEPRHGGEGREAGQGHRPVQDRRSGARRRPDAHRIGRGHPRR